MESCNHQSLSSQCSSSHNDTSSHGVFLPLFHARCVIHKTLQIHSNIQKTLGPSSGHQIIDIFLFVSFIHPSNQVWSSTKKIPLYRYRLSELKKKRNTKLKWKFQVRRSDRIFSSTSRERLLRFYFLERRVNIFDPCDWISWSIECYPPCLARQWDVQVPVTLRIGHSPLSRHHIYLTYFVRGLSEFLQRWQWLNNEIIVNKTKFISYCYFFKWK